MARVALISIEDNINRYIKNHPWLKLLPLRWANTLAVKGKPRFTKAIYKEGAENILGYILDIPDFFLNEDDPNESFPPDISENIIEILKEEDIKTLIFPYWRDFISLKEKEYLSINAIDLLDGYFIRLISLLETVRKLQIITEIGPGKGELGIWGADNPIGQLWVELLAPNINYLSLGGSNLRALERLRTELFYNTGLACQILTTPEECLKSKDIGIISGPIEREDYNNLGSVLKPKGLIIDSWNLSMGYKTPVANGTNGIWIDSGWPILPSDMKITPKLKEWDTIGLIEAILLMEHTEFSEIYHRGTFTLRDIEDLRAIVKGQEIVFDGMVSGTKLMSYNDFRRVFFAT